MNAEEVLELIFLPDGNLSEVEDSDSDCDEPEQQCNAPKKSC